MGRSKPLLPLGGRPVICRCLENLTASGVSETIVVLGSGSDGVHALIDGFEASVVENTIPGSDMAQSIRVGLEQVSTGSSAVLVCMADHPLVRTDTYNVILRCHYENPGRIIIPVHEGRRGHPPLLPKEIIAEIAGLPTLRDVVRRHPDMVLELEVEDEGVVLDMDTPEDYRRVLELFSERGSRGTQ